MKSLIKMGDDSHSSNNAVAELGRSHEWRYSLAR